MPDIAVDVIEGQPPRIAVVAEGQRDVVAGHQNIEEFKRFETFETAGNRQVLTRKFDGPVELNNARQNRRIVEMAVEIKQIVGQVYAEDRFVAGRFLRPYSGQDLAVHIVGEQGGKGCIARLAAVVFGNARHETPFARQHDSSEMRPQCIHKTGA